MTDLVGNHIIRGIRLSFIELALENNKTIVSLFRSLAIRIVI